MNTKSHRVLYKCLLGWKELRQKIRQKKLVFRSRAKRADLLPITSLGPENKLGA